MKFSTPAVISIISSTVGTTLLQSHYRSDLQVTAFAPTASNQRWRHALKSPSTSTINSSRLLATVQDETETSTNENKNNNASGDIPVNKQESLVSPNSIDSGATSDAKGGLPWWWDMVWNWTL
jgi:hypothetical protein